MLVSSLGLVAVCPAGDCGWTAKTAMPTARIGFSTSVVNGKIYAIGGASSLTGTYYATVEEYDPATDTWTRKANMPTARNGLATAVVHGKIYVVGGEPRAQASLRTVEEYDPVTDAWASKASMPTPRTFHCACAVSGKMYVLGGVTAGVSNTNWNPAGLDVYDAATDTWATKGPIPTPRSGAGVCVVNGRIYLIGGVIGSLHSTPVSTVEEYDPTTGTWATKAPMPTARMFLSTSVLNGKVYAAGGGVWNAAIFSRVERYNPVADTWARIDDMAGERHMLSISAVNGKLYAIGGTRQWYPGPGISTVEEYDPTLP